MCDGVMDEKLSIVTVHFLHLMRIVLTILCLAIAANAAKKFTKNDLIKAVDKSDNDKVREILTENPSLRDVRDKVT